MTKNRHQRRAMKSKMKSGKTFLLSTAVRAAFLEDPEEWDDDKRAAFADWISDDRNFTRVLREAERQGLIETSIRPDGKLWVRRTAKQTGEPLSEREVAERFLAIPRSRLIDLCVCEDYERDVVFSTTPDHLSDDALRLLIVLVKDLRGFTSVPGGKTREFKSGAVPSALCDLIGERRTKNAMAELEAADPDLAFSKHGIFAMKVCADALNEETRKLAQRYGIGVNDVWSLREYDSLLKTNPAKAKLMERDDPTLPAKYAEAKLKAEKFKAEAGRK